MRVSPHTAQAFQRPVITLSGVTVTGYFLGIKGSSASFSCFSFLKIQLIVLIKRRRLRFDLDMTNDSEVCDFKDSQCFAAALSIPDLGVKPPSSRESVLNLEISVNRFKASLTS